MPDKRNPNFVMIAGIVFVVLLFLTLLVKLVVVIFQFPLVFGGWAITALYGFFWIIGVVTGLILIVLITCCLIWSIKKLVDVVAESFNALNEKFNNWMTEKPDKVLPIAMAAFSTAVILILSKDFATTDTKMFLTVIVITVSGIVLVTASGKRKRWVGALSVFILAAFTFAIVCLKKNITSIDSFRSTIMTQLDLTNNHVPPMSTTDYLAMGLIGLSFFILLILSIYYSFRKI